MNGGDNIGFDDNGQRVLTTDFTYESCESSKEAELTAGEAVSVAQTAVLLLALIRLLSNGRNYKQAGRFIKLIEFALEIRKPLKKDLARELEISPGRVTQELKALRAHIASMVTEAASRGN